MRAPQKTWKPERFHEESRDENAAVRIKSAEVAEGLDGDNGPRIGLTNLTMHLIIIV